MRHPSPGDLIDLHFGELLPGRASACRSHLRGCRVCSAFAGELERVERLLATARAGDPPRDGLARVLSRIEKVQPARQRRDRALIALAPCASALLLGWAAVQQAGAWGALAFFILGSVVTLAIAPILILESKERPS